MADPTVENPTNDDGTWTTDDDGQTWVLAEPSEAFDANRPAPQDRVSDPAQLTEAQVLAKHVLAPKVRAEELTDAELVEVAPLFPEWRPGVRLEAGDVVRHGGVLFEVNEGQGHVSQPDWTPDVAASLFKPHRPAGEVSAWEPPVAPDFYPLDAVVTHGGHTWKSLHAANVWEPGTPGTEALWEQVG